MVSPQKTFMNIAVLGTGAVGKLIAARLMSLGHDVTIGTRSPAATLARTDSRSLSFLQWLHVQPHLKLESYAHAAAGAEIIFNCTAGQGSLEALELAGTDNLNGKILIDLANPLDFSNGMPPILNPVNEDSLGEQIQRAFPEVHVVKALNTMNAEIMVDPAKISGDHAVFIAGNNEEAKESVRYLLMGFGWKSDYIFDLGDITAARSTEMLLPLWLRLSGRLGTMRFNFSVVR
jgi:predicted dinucleotide-binding enzyme